MSQPHRYFRQPLHLTQREEEEQEDSRRTKRKEKKERKPRRYSLFALFLMGVGAATLLFLGFKYIVIPILMVIPH